MVMRKARQYPRQYHETGFQWKSTTERKQKEWTWVLQFQVQFQRHDPCDLLLPASSWASLPDVCTTSQSSIHSQGGKVQHRCLWRTFCVQTITPRMAQTHRQDSNSRHPSSKNSGCVTPLQTRLTLFHYQLLIWHWTLLHTPFPRLFSIPMEPFQWEFGRRGNKYHVYLAISLFLVLAT